ncbi:MAG: hypothetical protein Q9M89_00060 [Persephonella sp.]|nr:hypothetical protein [Persephonella sp.]
MQLKTVYQQTLEGRIHPHRIRLLIHNNLAIIIILPEEMFNPRHKQTYHRTRQLKTVYQQTLEGRIHPRRIRLPVHNNLAIIILPEEMFNLRYKQTYHRTRPAHPQLKTT